MRTSLERYHSYRTCPRCQSDVSGKHRFCRKCAYWLARPQTDGLRNIDINSTARKSRLFDTWAVVRAFQTSLHFILSGVFLGILVTLLSIYLLTNIMPYKFPITSEAKKRVCYSNNRIIRNAMEMYLQEHKFTKALASDPVKILYESGYLLYPPHCPVKGNKYIYVFKSSLHNASMPWGLICVGSEPHGLADK